MAVIKINKSLYHCLDFETEPIEKNNILPPPVCAVIYSGDTVNITKDLKREVGDLVKRAYIGEIFILGHNIGWDLAIAVKHLGVDKKIVFDIIRRGRVFCTMLRETLYQISTDGFPNAQGNGLASVSKTHLDSDIAEWKKDDVRTTYNTLKDIPVKDWPQKYIDYITIDGMLPWKIFWSQEGLRKPTGIGSINGQELMLAEAFASEFITDRGMLVNQESVAKLKKKIEHFVADSKMFLLETGYASLDKDFSFKKNNKKLQEYIAEKYPHKAEFSKKTEKVSTKDSSLAKLPQTDLVIKNYRDYMSKAKDLTTYIPALQKADPYIYFPFNPIVKTMRSSSRASKLFPSLNGQNLPGYSGIRECVEAPDGKIIVAIDYSGIEICSTAQHMINVYGHSKLADYINRAEYPTDMHSVLAVVTFNQEEKENLSYDEFLALKGNDDRFKKYRNLSKPSTLGYPGGRGPRSIMEQSAELGVVQPFSFWDDSRDNYFELFPQVRNFLKGEYEVVRCVEEWKDITLENEYKVYSRYKGTVTIRNDLGLKKKYKTAYFETVSKRVPPKIEEWKNGKVYDKERGRFDDAYAYEINGVYRNKCNYTEMGNGINMQSLAAHGLKIAICRLEESGIAPIHNKVHDELLFIMPIDEYKELSVKCGYVMIDSMQKVMPNNMIAVEISAMKIWTKDEDKHIFTKKIWRPKKC